MDKVQPECAVTIRYVMRSHLTDGTVKERPEEELEFIYGIQRQVPTLEGILEGAVVGDTFSARIPPSEIYGEHDPGLIREIPKAGFIKQRLRAGEFYRQMKKGCLVSFKVLEVKPDTVLADFNEPMAGIAVSIDLEVLGIRKPSEREIEKARDAEFKRKIGCG